MLRINLLPTYVSQRKLTRKIVFGGSLLLLVCLALPLFLWMQANQAKEHWLQEAQAAEAGKAITDKAKADAASTRAQIAPLLAKVKFVKDVHQHNTDIVDFWNTVAAYSDPKVVYSDAAVSGTTLTIKAYTPSIAVVGRYLQTMYSEPAFVTVGIDRLPGYPEAVVNKYYLNNKLIAIDSATGQSGGGGFGGGFGASAPGGLVAGAGGFGGGASASFGGGGGTNSGTGGAVYGSAAPVGGASQGVPQISASTGNNGPVGSDGVSQADSQKLAQVLLNDPKFRNVALNPFAPPQSQFQAILSLVKKIKVRREPQGFPITVTATLKEPLVVPQLPGTAAASATGGLPGGAPGFPGAPPPGYGGSPGGPEGRGVPTGPGGPPGR